MLRRVCGISLAIAALAGCGSGETKTVTSTVSQPAADGVTQTAQQRTDSELIRSVLNTTWETLDGREWAAYCNLLTPDARRDAVSAADPNDATDNDVPCDEAFTASEGPTSYAAAKVLDVFPGRDTAIVVLDDGGPNPLTIEMKKTPDGWRTNKTPYWSYQHQDADF